MIYTHSWFVVQMQIGVRWCRMLCEVLVQLTGKSARLTTLPLLTTPMIKLRQGVMRAKKVYTYQEFGRMLQLSCTTQSLQKSPHIISNPCPFCFADAVFFITHLCIVTKLTLFNSQASLCSFKWSTKSLPLHLQFWRQYALRSRSKVFLLAEAPWAKHSLV